MSETSPQQPEDNSGGVRRMVLFGILAIGLVALGYDYFVARPSVETAYADIVKRSEEINRDSTKKFTNVLVQEVVGKTPSETFQDPNGDTVEVFSWRSGLPIRTHNLYAVYKPSGDDLLFYRHAKFKYEASKDVSGWDGPTVIQAPEGGYEEGPGGGGPPAGNDVADDGGSGGRGGPGDGGGEGRNRPELEEESETEPSDESEATEADETEQETDAEATEEPSEDDS